MLPLSARSAVDFTPAWYDGGENAPIFKLKVPTLLERSGIRAAMTAAGLGYAADEDVRQALREVIEQIGERDAATAARYAEALDAEEKSAPGEDRPADDLALIAALEKVALQHYPPFAALLAQRQAWLDGYPIVLFQRFCVGWSGYPCAYRREMGQVAEDVLAELPPRDVLAAGWRLSAFMRPSGQDAKNSEAPSRSPSAAANSPAQRKRPTAGKVGR